MFPNLVSIYSANVSVIVSSADSMQLSLLVVTLLSLLLLPAASYPMRDFRRLNKIQFIAALGDPQASSGTGAEQWGIWTVDPGPRGVRLQHYDRLKSSPVIPAGWHFDPTDFWIEEHGLFMEPPTVPMVAPTGRTQKYVVSGDREVTAVLTVEPDGRWELDKKAVLYDVTHLPCRSARYIVNSSDGGFEPQAADLRQFPVRPGAAMPSLSGEDSHTDYAVHFVFAVAVDNTDTDAAAAAATHEIGNSENDEL